MPDKIRSSNHPIKYVYRHTLYDTYFFGMLLILSGMQKVTVTLDDRQIRELQARQHIDGLDNRSEAIRHIIDQYAELLSEHAELEEDYLELYDRYQSRQDRIEQLEEQLAKRSNIESDIQEVSETVENLPAKINRTESYQEKRARKLDKASLGKRLKWKLTGVPVDQDDQ